MIHSRAGQITVAKFKNSETAVGAKRLAIVRGLELNSTHQLCMCTNHISAYADGFRQGPRARDAQTTRMGRFSG